MPAELEAYTNVVKHFNCSGQLRHYLGSPLITCQLLREQDNLRLVELRPNDYSLLHSEFQKDNRTHVEEADDFQRLKAKPPQVSRHGLILIDPPYKMRTDYQAVVNGIIESYRRFAIDTYTLWCPVMLRQQIKRMIHDLEVTDIRKVLQTEPAVLPNSDRRGMTAFGMTVVNPSWKLEQQMNDVLPWLYSKPVPTGIGHAIISWIAPE